MHLGFESFLSDDDEFVHDGVWRRHTPPPHTMLPEVRAYLDAKLDRPGGFSVAKAQVYYTARQAAVDVLAQHLGVSAHDPKISHELWMAEFRDDRFPRNVLGVGFDSKGRRVRTLNGNPY